MDLATLASPMTFLHSRLRELPGAPWLADYEAWWRSTGAALSAGIDRAGTPWLQMFDAGGERVDNVVMAGGYRQLLLQGYRAGAVWRGFAGDSLVPTFLLGYLTAFFDPGLYCPHTVSLATALALAKDGAPPLRERFLEPLLRRDDRVWQGATWMTEIGGGSDLGANVATTARPEDEVWRLDGVKYFTSNVGAELAVVAARPQGAPAGVRGLALYLLPRLRRDGALNYRVRRLKDKIGTRSVPTGEVELENSEAYLLGRQETGIYQILEVLNLSRCANSVAAVALAQRAIADAAAFAAQRVAFGRPVLEQPLLAGQFARRCDELQDAFALAWAAVRLLDRVKDDKPPYPPRYQLFRLVAHLAKYWTAEIAIGCARWGIEVHGGLGVLAEFPAERHLREALVLAIWEGTSHRQMLDGLEVAARRQAHHLLLEEFGGGAELRAAVADFDALLAQPEAEREAGIEPVFARLAKTLGGALRRGQ